MQNPKVQIDLELDPSGLEEGIRVSEQAIREMQAGMERLGENAPPLALPPSALPPTPLAGAGRSDFFFEMMNELSGVRSRMREDPAASGDRLQALWRELKDNNSENPQNYDEFIELKKEIAKLTGFLEKSQDQAVLQQFNRAMGVANVAGQVMGGNLLGGAGAGIGMLLGGPIGSYIGSTIGGMAQGVINSAGSGVDFDNSVTDLQGRFGGNFRETESLKDYAFNRPQNDGYDSRQFMGLVDQARAGRLIGDTTEGSLDLVQGMAALGRALGMNAEAVIQLEAAYKRTGGDGESMARIVAGAVSVGMQANLDQYAEVIGSARQQIVNSTASGLDDNEVLMQLFQGLLEGESGSYFRDNPGAAVAGLSGILGLGSSSDPSSLSTGLLAASGVNLAQINGDFNSSEQLQANLGLRLGASQRQIFGDQSPEQLQRQALADPNFVQNYFTDEAEGFGRQQIFGGYFPELRGNATGTKALMAVIQSQLENGGTLQGISDNPALAQFQAEYGQSDAQRAREAEASFRDQTTQFYDEIRILFTQSREILSGIWGGVNTLTSMAGVFETEGSRDQRITYEINEAIRGGVDRSVSSKDLRAGVGFYNDLVPYAEEDGLLQGQLQQASQGYDVSFSASDLIRLRDLRANAEGRPSYQYYNNPGELKPYAIPINDSPPGGIMATDSQRIFQFAPGDMIFARHAGIPNEVRSGGSRVAHVTININGNSSIDPTQLRQQTQEGVMAAFDELDRDFGSSEPGSYRNQPRIRQSVY